MADKEPKKARAPRAEKAPNRKGVQAVLRHFQTTSMTFDDVAWQAGEGKLQAVYLAGGYPPRAGGWITEQQAKSLSKVETLVVHDLLPSPARRSISFTCKARAAQTWSTSCK